MHCVKCHKEFYYTMDDWFNNLPPHLLRFDPTDDEGAPITYGIIAINNGEQIIAGLTRKDISASVHEIKNHDMFCTAEDNKTQ